MARVKPPEGTPLRCFMALAFGYRDTDAVYAVIRRTVKPLGIALRRVDRIEHNENIDAKILSELEAADLVIADLTYARPSVYFEAGYAQRAIPVIYTARSDHFREKDDDPHGNRHVHFDLKMRNIIGWSRPDDRTFPTRLAARVAKVTAPLVRRKERDTERTRLVTAFDRLSQDRKRDRLIETARAHFETLGYAVTDLRHVHGDKPHVSYELRSSLAAIKQSGQKFRFVCLHVVPSVTARVLGAYRYEVIFRPLYDRDLFKPPRTLPKDIHEDIVVCSMQTGSLRRLRSDLAMLHVGETDGTLQCDRGFPFRDEGDNPIRHLTFHILDTSAKLATLPAFLSERFTRRPR